MGWRAVDDAHARVSITLGAITVWADLAFDARGDLADFVSHDRGQSSDGKTYRRVPWSTPVDGWIDTPTGRRLDAARAVWGEPDGPFTYGELRLVKHEIR